MGTQRTLDELREASNHLHYEIVMFQTVGAGVLSGVARRSAIQNALIESFAIHTRNLIDFFYHEGVANPKSDDIFAINFFDGETSWTDNRTSITPLLTEARTRANKEIAHLTYTRLGKTDEDKHWKIPEIQSEVMGLVESFVRSVSPELLGSQWHRDVDA